ncbi:MAG: response regulator [Microcoleus sp. PH2017_01_SCD_O_A]|uniref:hybrid sensor histidine kinase/response regulator n=1 Tax=Microcoleus sp. PH2017_01_SCD_O_A TaxID=2798812 RepID=UPI001D5A7ED0|nr:response regulator [Microcoleus sp. PH2017_01_SCD_O_A]MCC3425096.1 response regulator [Microcoleus sp. PH2017_01_SCD_O_A]
MLPEQQQRIMGYFIEEAKDHLNTIEQGLLNLQATIEDPELVNEVFRAAHSVKGGAAMLGLTSIQQTSHRLEDSFKILKECSVKVDQQLESLFLRIFDTLQGLLEQLSGPFGLTEELGEQMVRELEPVFEELNGHLGGLVGHCANDSDESSPLPIPQTVMARMGAGTFNSSMSFADSDSAYASDDLTETEETALHLVFDSDVPARMREMLQEFKQPEGSDSRRQLRNICRNLKMAGEEFELPEWIELIAVVEKAIANSENTYRTLAPTVIKDIKQAQEQVLLGQSGSIAPSAKLLALVPTVVVPETDFEDLLAFAQPGTLGSNAVSVEDAAWDLALGGDSPDGSNKLLPTISGLSIDELFEQLDGDESDDYAGGLSPLDNSPGFGESDVETGSFRISTRTGPEVGAAELNTLADLFEGESPDLDGAWEEEDDLDYVQSASRMPTGGIMELDDDDNSGDFTDLLFDEYGEENSETNARTPLEDLTSLFGDDLLFGGEADGSAVAADRENAGLKQPPTRKQLETNRQGLDRGEGRVGITRRQADEDALGTLLDEVAAQTSVVTADADLDNLFGDLGSSEEATVPAVSEEYALNPDAFDAEFSDLLAGGGNDSGDAEKPTVAEIDDFELLSGVEEDSDFSELLSITSDFLSSEGEAGESRGDRSLATGSTPNEESGSVFNMTSNSDSDSDLDISADGDWLEDAFGLEDESVQSTNLDLEDTDLDALFGEITSDSISEDEETGRDRQAVHSQEAANLADLFGSVPTGTEYDGEASPEVDGDWLNLNGDSQLPSAGTAADEGDLASLFSDSEATVSEAGLTDLAAAELGLLSDRPDAEIASVESDEGTFDLLEDMFGEAPPPSVDAEAGFDLQELSAEVPESLFDRAQTDAASESDEEEDDLFGALETDFAAGDLEVMSSESLDDMFEGDADLLAALETGATLNTEELDAFDDLLDSLDAGPLVTSELTGFGDEEEELSEADAAQLEDESLADFFSDIQSGTEDSEGNFDDLEALLIAGGAGVAMAASGGANPSPVTTEVFSDLEDLLSESATMPEIPAPAKTARKAPPAPAAESDDEFGDLEKLLEDPKDSGRQSETNIGQSSVNNRPRRNARAGGFGDQTMRVPVKQLDNLSNLMGELVVNRNSLEQDQERMRQFLDNLLHQVTLLSDVSQRTQDFYERSLLEIALLANRQGHRSAWRTEESSHQRESAWRPEEMDRFTPFHSLAQEIIELIVRVRESAADIEFLVDEADQVTRQLRQVTTQLQEGLTRARMKPFAETTDRLFRAVREIGIKCGKQAQLQVEGKDILIDKMIVDQLYDPMTHLVNNAITHGIEAPEVRLAAGKPAMGRITIRAFHQGNQTVVSVSDDGAGIDPQKVKAKAIKQNLLTAAQAQRMSRSEVYNLLFMPGFSTQEQATEYAGRGVGMNVVETSLHEIRGTVGIDSTIGKGTVFTIRLPLVLSISKALTCISDRARIAFPMDGVEDMIDVPRDQVTTGADGLPCIEWRGSILPFRPLRDLLGYNRHLGRGSVYGFNTDDDMISVIVLRSAGNFLAVQVDQVSTEQEIVIKQLEGPVPKPIGIAGATVLGDGKIVAIADVLELIDLATGRLRKEAGGTLWDESGDRAAAEAAEEKTEPTVLIVDDSITVRSLLSITFEKAGYRVEEARDGKEAWEKMKSGLPCDIVFCDIEMPRMDGLELLSRMQKDAVLCELPIAMLTSRGADRHRQMAYSLGAKGYFTKPYLEEQLMDAAARMLKGEVVGAPVVV